MSTFDASTGQQDMTPVPEGYDAEPEPVDDGLDTLALLEEAAAQKAREEEETKPEIVVVDGVGLRLVCADLNIPSKKLTSWQRRALPPQLRNSAQPSPLAMDQVVLNTAVLVNTCTSVQVLRKGGDPDNDADWRTVTDTNGEVCTLASKALWEKLRALDSVTAVKKLFPRDSDLLRKGQQVLDAAGWTEARMYGDEDGEDPTS
jgi:hypothetical protein